MEISFSTVRKMTIEPDRGQTIYVFLEDFRPQVGRMTIICDGDVWSYGWGAMGKHTPTLDTFIAKCNVQYVTMKLAPNISPKEDDLGALPTDAEKHVIKRRREGDLDKEAAREL